MKKNYLLCDISRALAAIMIVFYHLTTRYEELIGHAGYYKFNLPWGYMGWSVFFVLSGFLHKAEPTTNVKSYIINKIVRLYPAYVGGCLIGAISAYVMLPEFACGTKDFILDLTMLGTYMGAVSATGVDWTLSIEIIFYVFIAFAICLRRKMKFEYFYELTALIWTLCSWLLLVGYSIFPSIALLKYITILSAAKYSYMFTTGIMLRLISEKKNLKLGIIGLIICLWIHGYHYGMGGYMMFYIIVVLLFMSYVLTPWENIGKIENILRNYKIIRVLVWIASISYPLYLMHEYFGFAILRFLDNYGITSELSIVIPIILSAGIAYLFHKFVEIPLQVKVRKN